MRKINKNYIINKLNDEDLFIQKCNNKSLDFYRIYYVIKKTNWDFFTDIYLCYDKVDKDILNKKGIILNLISGHLCDLNNEDWDFYLPNKKDIERIKQQIFLDGITDEKITTFS